MALEKSQFERSRSSNDDDTINICAKFSTLETSHFDRSSFFSFEFIPNVLSITLTFDTSHSDTSRSVKFGLFENKTDISLTFETSHLETSKLLNDVFAKTPYNIFIDPVSQFATLISSSFPVLMKVENRYSILETSNPDKSALSKLYIFIGTEEYASSTETFVFPDSSFPSEFTALIFIVLTSGLIKMLRSCNTILL